MKNKPFEVCLTSRQVIENKLLTSLEDGEQVAILASEQDLKDIIASLLGYELATRTGSILSWEDHIQRRQELASGLKQLLDSAFPKVKQ